MGADALVSLAAVVVVRGSGAAGGILTARLLGPADKGIYSVLFLAAILLGAVLTLGLDLWAVREVAAGTDRSRVAGMVRHHLRRTDAVILALATAAGAGVLAAGAGPAGLAGVAMCAALAAGSTRFVFTLAMPLGDGRIGRHAAVSAAGSLVYAAGVVLLWATGTAAVAAVLAVAALGRWLPVARWGRTRRDPAEAPGRARYRATVRSWAPASAGTLLEVAAYRLDVLVVAALAGATTVGLYATALTFAEALALVPAALAQVLLSRAAREPSAARTATVARLSVLATGLAGIVLALTARPLVRGLFGAAYEDAAVAVPLLAAAAVALAVWKVVTADLLARGVSGARAWSGAIAMTAMIGADVVLVPAFGIAGAAAGSVLGYAAGAAHAVVAWRRVTGAPARTLVLVRPSDLATLGRAVRAAAARGRRTGAEGGAGG